MLRAILKIRFFFILVAVFLTYGILRSEVAGQLMTLTDDSSVKIGMWDGKALKTIRIQALSGDWSAKMQLNPPQNASGPLFSEERVVEIPEQEFMTLEVTSKGISPKTSQGQEFSPTFACVEFSGGGLLSVEMGGKTPQIFRGRLRVFKRNKSLFAENTTTLSSYLVSVASRIIPSSEPEAIKAAIVAMRTWAVASKQLGRHASDTFDFCDTDHCFRFDGVGEDRELVKVLAEETKNEILTYKGKPFLPYFHHTCGGKISSAKDIFNIPDEIHIFHLDKIDDKETENCFHSPCFTWTREFSKKEMSEFLAISYAGGANNVFVRWEPTKVDPAGRICEVKVSGNHQRIISGLDFFANLNDHFGKNAFKSLKFTSQTLNRSVIYLGSGEGHGVGMCLMGADGLARKDWDYKKILGFYYQGISVETTGKIEKEAKPSKKAGEIKDRKSY